MGVVPCVVRTGTTPISQSQRQYPQSESPPDTGFPLPLWVRVHGFPPPPLAGTGTTLPLLPDTNVKNWAVPDVGRDGLPTPSDILGEGE